MNNFLTGNRISFVRNVKFLVYFISLEMKEKFC